METNLWKVTGSIPDISTRMWFVVLTHNIKIETSLYGLNLVYWVTVQTEFSCYMLKPRTATIDSIAWRRLNEPWLGKSACDNIYDNCAKQKYLLIALWILCFSNFCLLFRASLFHYDISVLCFFKMHRKCDIFLVNHVQNCFPGICVETLKAVNEIAAVVKVLQEDMLRVKAAFAGSLQENVHEIVEFSCHKSLQSFEAFTASLETAGQRQVVVCTCI